MHAHATTAEPRAHLHCLIPPRLHKDIKRVALEGGTTIGEIVAEILGPEIGKRLDRIGRDEALPLKMKNRTAAPKPGSTVATVPTPHPRASLDNPNPESR